MQKIKTCLCVAGLALVVSTSVGAQEELPTPKARTAAPPIRPLADPERADLRAQRRERLRNLGGQVLNALATPDGAATPGAAPVLDLGKLNDALGPLATMLLGGGRDIESLKIGFDPQGTNFAEDRLRIAADAALRRTAWADAPSQFHGTLGVQVVPNDGGGMVAVIDTRIRLQTSTVALANYMVAQYKSRSRTEDTAPAPEQAPAPAGVENLPTVNETSADDLFQELLDERLARVDRLESLDDVADLLTAISGLRLTAADQRIAELRSRARSAASPDEKRELEGMLAQARAERDRLLDIRPRFNRGTDGAVKSIGLDMIGSEIFPGADMRQMECRISDNEVTLQATGALTRWIELYPVVKPLVMGILQRIQTGDPRALDMIRPFVDGPIGRGRALIIGAP